MEIVERRSVLQLGSAVLQPTVAGVHGERAKQIVLRQELVRIQVRIVEERVVLGHLLRHVEVTPVE